MTVAVTAKRLITVLVAMMTVPGFVLLAHIEVSIPCPIKNRYCYTLYG